MNSRCEDLSSVDQIDSGANSSKEDEVDNNSGGGSSKGDEQEQLRQKSCDQHQAICYTSDQESSLEDGQEHSEGNQDTITANTTKCDTKQRRKKNRNLNFTEKNLIFLEDDIDVINLF